MDFFEKLGDTISIVGKDVANKTRKLTDTTRYTSQITAEERKIAILYQAIGEAYYGSCHEEAPAPYGDLVSQIDQHKRRIDHLKKLLNDMKGLKPCPFCNCNTPVNSTYCCGCGAGLTSLKKDEPFEEEVPMQEESFGEQNTETATDSVEAAVPEQAEESSEEDTAVPNE